MPAPTIDEIVRVTLQNLSMSPGQRYVEYRAFWYYVAAATYLCGDPMTYFNGDL